MAVKRPAALGQDPVFLAFVGTWSAVVAQPKTPASSRQQIILI
jgi:hypothetical protein